jgi:hypothetical protein
MDNNAIAQLSFSGRFYFQLDLILQPCCMHPIFDFSGRVTSTTPLLNSCLLLQLLLKSLASKA